MWAWRKLQDVSVIMYLFLWWCSSLIPIYLNLGKASCSLPIFLTISAGIMLLTMLCMSCWEHKRLTLISGLLNFFTSCCDQRSSVGPQIFHFLLWPVQWWFLFLMVTMWTHLVFFCNLSIEPQPLWNLILQEKPQVSLSLMLKLSYLLND